MSGLQKRPSDIARTQSNSMALETESGSTAAIEARDATDATGATSTKSATAVIGASPSIASTSTQSIGARSGSSKQKKIRAMSHHKKGELITEEYLEERRRQDGPIFEDSCHREFVYYGHTRSLTALLVSSGVIVAQTALYIVFLDEAIDEILQDTVPVDVNYHECKNYNKGQLVIEESVVTIGNQTTLTTLLQCSAETPSNLELAALLPALLLSSYTMAPLVNSVKAFFLIEGNFSKFAAAILFLQNVLAIFTGIMWAFQGYWTGSAYSSIVNCVGVLFVHEIDERVSHALHALQKRHMNCNFCTEKAKKYVRVLVPLVTLVVIYCVTVATMFFGHEVLEGENY